MMSMHIRRATGLLAATLFVVACGGSPAATIGPGVTASPGASITLPSIVPDQPLEDLFPDEVGGQALNVQSATGQSIMTLFNNSDTAEFDAFLADLGTSIDQLSAAMGIMFIPPPTGGGELSGLTMMAMRVRNIPAATVAEKFGDLVRQDIENAQISQQSIAGKTVTAIVDPEDPEASAYLYPVGDVVFMVGGTPDLVEEALSKLP
jgi:hypothetical protein